MSKQITNKKENLPKKKKIEKREWDCFRPIFGIQLKVIA